MNSDTGTFPTTDYNDMYRFTSAKGKEEVPPWNGHSPKGRRPDGKWGLKSMFGLSTLHLLFHPILCFYELSASLIGD